MEDLVIRHHMAEGHPDVMIVELSGNLDTFTSEKFSAATKDIVAQGWNKIVVDLKDVEFVSSSGWGALIGSLRKAHEAGGSLVLTNMKGQVKRVFKMMGFRAILRHYDSVEEAVKALAGQ